MASQQPPFLSADGQWSWDGYRWNPVQAVHGWKWDGQRWVRRTKPIDRLRNLPKWLVWSLAIWLLFLIAWIPTVTVVASHHDSPTFVRVLALVVVALAVFATIGFGGTLGYRREWGYLAWSLVVGVIIIGFVMFIAFGASQPTNQPDDPGLGIGAMFVTAALSPIVALLLWFGGGVGVLFRQLRRG